MKSIRFNIIALHSIFIFTLIASTGCGTKDTAAPGGGASGPSTVLITLSPSSIPSSGTAAVSATVTDASNNALSGISVDFSVSNVSAGSFSASSATTDASGVASVQFTANAVTASVIITASVTLSSGNIITNSAVLTIGSGGGGGGGGGGGSAGSVTVSASPTTIAAHNVTVVSATVRDSAGALVADGTPVSFTLSSGSMGTLSSATAATSGGTAMVTLTASSTAGSLTVTASATLTGGTITGTTAITITATSPNDMSFTASSTSVPATTTSTLTALVVDNLGWPVANTQVTFGLDSGLKGMLSAGSAFTNSSGIATVVFTAGSQSAIATVTAAVGSINRSTQITITGAGNITVSVTAVPSAIVSGSTSTITATVNDTSGGSPVPVSGASVVLSLSNSAANFYGAATYSGTTNASGVVTAVLTGSSATTTTVTVTATALGTSGTANVTITPSSTIGSLTLTALPASIVTMATTTINAILLDSTPAPVVGETINFTISPAAGTLSSSSAVTNASGVATVTLTAGSLPTSIIVTASATTLPYSTLPPATTTVTITVPPPASVTVVPSPTSILVLGTATITATVLDSSANPVPDGQSVSFSLSDTSYGSLSMTTTSTGSGNGTATTTFIANNKPGGVTITATAGTVNNNTTLNITPAATGSIKFVSANPQVIGIAGSGYIQTSSVAFYVSDINGNAAADGTSVTFNMNGPQGGAYITGSVAGATVATSSTVSGNATVTLHSGSVAGPVTIIAATYVNSVGVQTTLSNAISSPTSTAAISVTSTGSFPSSGKIRIDNEIIEYASISGNTFTGITRGAVSTTATSHLIGVQVYGQDTIYAQSTQISIGGGIPSAGRWNLATSQFNLAGLKYSGLEATISTYIADRFGNYNILQGTVINYYPEAGAMPSSAITDATGRAAAVIRTQQSDDFADVTNTASGDADSADFAQYYGGGDEPWRISSAIPVSHPTTTYNPRDGWVTVLATTMGEEKFLDENGDGMFTRSLIISSPTSTTTCPPGYSCECDGGVTNGYNSLGTIGPTAGTRTCSTGNRSEAFVDLGEPFYDNNDNGKRDTGSIVGYPFEQFIDTDGNHTYDGPNKAWDGQGCNNTNSPCLQSKMIWKDIRLVFSGDYYFLPYPDVNNCYTISSLSTRLSTTITAGDTTIPVMSTVGFPSPSGTLYIEGENVDYTGISGNDFTGCTRGVSGTTAAAHAINALVYSGTCAATYDNGGFAVAPTSMTKGDSELFCVIIGDRNLNSLPGGTVLSASASPGTVSAPTSVTLLDGLSTGPSMFCFMVSISATEAQNSTAVSVSVDGGPPAIANVTLNAPPIIISSPSVLPAGTVSAAYSTTLTATGGTSPYTWVVTSGALPSGLSLSSAGVISGTPPVGSGGGTVSNFTVTLTDSVGVTGSKAFSITIN